MWSQIKTRWIALALFLAGGGMLASLTTTQKQQLKADIEFAVSFIGAVPAREAEAAAAHAQAEADQATADLWWAQWKIDESEATLATAQGAQSVADESRRLAHRADVRVERTRRAEIVAKALLPLFDHVCPTCDLPPKEFCILASDPGYKCRKGLKYDIKGSGHPGLGGVDSDGNFVTCACGANDVRMPETGPSKHWWRRIKQLKAEGNEAAIVELLVRRVKDLRNEEL